MAKKNNPTNKIEIPEAVIKRLEFTLKAEVQDFKTAFKNEFIQLSDRVDELAENIGDGKRGESRLLIAQKMFATNRKEILEVSRIPRLAVRPYAIALTLDAQDSWEVQSGEVSLTAIKIDYEMRLQLSGGGFNRGLFAPALIEEVGARSEEEGRMQEIEAGGK